MVKLNGVAIKELRCKKDMTQAQLAGLAGLCKSYISLAEAGEVNNPHYASVMSLAEALRVDHKDIIKQISNG